MSYKLQKITEPVVLGEGPHWDARTQALYFVSIPEKTIHKYNPATRQHLKTKLDTSPGFIVPVEGKPNQYVVGAGKKFLIIEWDGQNNSQAKVVRELFEIDQESPHNKLNDGKADPKGRLYAGTLGHDDAQGEFIPEAGSLFRLDGDKKVTKLESGIGISNGLAWDVKAKAMYYVDSLEKKVRRYDWDPETGDISNKRYIFDLEQNGLPGIGDGATIDTDGNLWLAIFEGSAIVKIDPNTGKILLKIDMPAMQVTSCTFGGPNLDILFVTTASMTIKDEQKPPCGSVFMVTGLGVKGHPNMNFKL